MKYVTENEMNCILWQLGRWHEDAMLYMIIVINLSVAQLHKYLQQDINTTLGDTFVHSESVQMESIGPITFIQSI